MFTAQALIGTNNNIRRTNKRH